MNYFFLLTTITAAVNVHNSNDTSGTPVFGFSDDAEAFCVFGAFAADEVA